MRKYRANKGEREIKDQKQREKKRNKITQLSEEEKLLVREQNSVCKQKFRENQKHELSHQELQGLLQMDRKGKRKKDVMRKSQSIILHPESENTERNQKPILNSTTPPSTKQENYQNCYSQIFTSLSAFLSNNKSSVFKRCVKQLSPGSK